MGIDITAALPVDAMDENKGGTREHPIAMGRREREELSLEQLVEGG